MKKIFAIYSFIYINYVNHSIIFYNTETGEYITTNKLDPQLFSKLKINTSSYYLDIKNISWNNQTSKLFKRMEEKHFGEFIYIQNTHAFPLLFSPFISIKNNAIDDFNKTEEEKGIFKENTDIYNKNTTDNLQEITIHYSRLNKYDFIHKKIYYQYNFPQTGDEVKLDINALLISIKSINTNHIRINIIIGDIKKSDIEKINFFLKHITYHNIYIYTIHKNIKYINSINIKKEHIIIWTFPYEIKEINHKINNIGLYSTETDYKILKETGFNELKLFPFYTENNFNFIKKELSYSLKDIFIKKINISTLFSNSNLNSNLYGELTILSNGDVFSNICQTPIGNISSNSIREITYLELTKNKNWFSKRSDFQPCNNCIYNIFCNPITKMEFLLNRYDFCNKTSTI